MVYLLRRKPYTRWECTHDMALSLIFPFSVIIYPEACHLPLVICSESPEFHMPCFRHHLGLISMPLQAHRQMCSGNEAS